jgi:hypothetical protein
VGGKAVDALHTAGWFSGTEQLSFLSAQSDSRVNANLGPISEVRLTHVCKTLFSVSRNVYQMSAAFVLH